ncbi:MAG: hypothetical protein QXS21_06545 [Thermoproteota archaeon]
MSSDSLSSKTSNDLTKLYQAFDTLTKLKDNILTKAASLTMLLDDSAMLADEREQKRAYKRISNKIKQTYAIVSDAYGFAESVTKILTTYFTTPDHTTTFSVETRGVKIDKDSIIMAIIGLFMDLNQLTDELSITVDDYKNVIESQYVGAIEQYISMLEDFRSAFVRFGEIATNILPS